MKKAIKIGAFAFAGALLFASCKKDWTCECTVGGETITKQYTDMKKKDAEAACEGKASVGVVSVSVNNGCSLK